jgi:hypothetical protein
MKRYIRIDGVIYNGRDVFAKEVTLEEVVEDFVAEFFETIYHPKWPLVQMIQVLEGHVRSLESAVTEHPKPPEPETFP